jgi:ligand-binding sensor domain-containing protein
MFAGTSHGVYRWTQGGTGWTSARGGLPSGTVRCLKSIGPYVFAGTDTGGVWMTSNRGATWSDVNAGIPDARDLGFARLAAIALAEDGENLYLSLPGTGVWRRPLSEMISVALRPPLAHGQRGTAKGKRRFPVPLYRADAPPGSLPHWFDAGGRLRTP